MYYGPVSQTVMTCFNGHQHRKSCKGLKYFNKKKKFMYIYNTLYSITFATNYKKIVNAAYEGVF